jgi:hypothetical protein
LQRRDVPTEIMLANLFWGNGGARCDFRIYDCRGISQAQEQDNIARYFKAPTRMSEYQYYEFQRVDGRLSEKEMQELRAYSTRARITSTSFINEYHFGSFKGNADAWMEKYFDGFLYLANRGTAGRGLRPLLSFARRRLAQHGVGIIRLVIAIGAGEPSLRRCQPRLPLIFR